MKIADLVAIRDEISALLLAKADGDYQAEADLAGLAARQLEQMTCMGGSTRSKGETEIVRLVKRFDDTRSSRFAPWPVSAFMIERDQRAETFRSALLACIEAHKTGRYEPMVAAIEAAENVIADIDRIDRAAASNTTTE